MFSVNAQTTFGVKAGVNIANFAGDNWESDARTGMHFGVFAEIDVSESLAFQPEILYSMHGGKWEEMGMDDIHKLDYINIPLMLKFKASDKFNIEAGPQIGFLASAKWDYDGSDVDIKDEFKSTDFGLNIGASFDLTDNFFIGARYTIGLSKVAEDEYTDSEWDPTNSNLMFSVGYSFN